jgi:uncharacterized protein (TIGR02466 family)
MSQVTGVFPIPVYESFINLGEDQIYAVKTTPLIRTQGNDGDISVNKKVLDEASYADIKSEVVKHVEIFARDFLRVKECVKFYIVRSWVMRHHAGDHALAHTHPNSVLSGILYIDVDESSGQLALHKEDNNTPFPKALSLPVDEYNTYNGSTIWCTPQNGLIVIFPSSLKHSVSPSRSNRLRYCIAFDVFPRGEIGDGDLNSLIELCL